MGFGIDNLSNTVYGIRMYGYLRSRHPGRATMRSEDHFGQVVTAGQPASVDVWDMSLREILDFRGEPADRLHELTATDDAFVMGLVVTTVGSVLGGDDPLAESLQTDLAVLAARCGRATERERDHAGAVATLADGNFTAAAARWEAIGARHPHDVVATKMAHDIYLHVGDDARRLLASTAVIGRLRAGDPGYGVAAGQHAFALEEVGRYEEAELFGRLALEVDAVDIWALHALAHVYEMQGRHLEAVEHLRSTRADWEERDHLALHLLWHLSLRLIDAGEFDECLEIFDGQVDDADRAFGLTDLTSMLWRLELAGCDVVDLWSTLAARWRDHDQLHTTAFLDVHAALVFASCPDDPGADRYWAGLDACHRAGVSENDETFDLVVRPLAAAIRSYREGRYRDAADGIDHLSAVAHRLGGSIVQRDVFAITASEAVLRGGHRRPAEEVGL